MAKQTRYTEGFRKKAVRFYLNGNLSAAQLSKKLGIHEHTMCRWIRTYHKNGFESQQTFDDELLLLAPAQVEQTSGSVHTAILECIHDIQKQIAELEELVFKQTKCDKPEI